MYKCLIILFVLTPSLLSAQSPAKVYVVNIQKVISDSVPGKSARNDLEALMKKSEAKLARYRYEIEQMSDDLKKHATLLSQKAVEQKRETLRKRRIEYKRLAEDQKSEIAKKNRRELEKLIAVVRKAVRELADQNNYEIVVEMDPKVVLYVDGNFDISQKVVELINKQVVDL